MKTIRIPKKFWHDHDNRDLDTPVVLRETKAHFFIAGDDPANSELLSDAEFYAAPWGPDDFEGAFGLKSSARATARALRDAGIEISQE